MLSQVPENIALLLTLGFVFIILFFIIRNLWSSEAYISECDYLRYYEDNILKIISELKVLLNKEPSEEFKQFINNVINQRTQELTVIKNIQENKRC